jgi:hypothetical protein
MSHFDDLFMANYEATCQDLRLREELDAALTRYNDLFVSGSQKILKLVAVHEP